jgi:GAF domain-containing protein
MEQTGFAHAARLEFDDLLEQLVARARDMRQTQSRLRALLDAQLAVARADDLAAALQHIVDAAAKLVNAGYAALSVVAEGRLTRFVHSGTAPETISGSGGTADDGTSGGQAGLPGGHPPRRTLLGLPIRLGERVFGNLYLTDKRGGGEFTAEDEELALALAAAAAAAIDNATLLDESRRRQSWQNTLIGILTGLLAGDDSDEALLRLVRCARRTLGAEGAGINIPVDGREEWRAVFTDGSYIRYQDVLIPMRDSLTATAVAAGELVVVADPASDERTSATTRGQAPGSIGETLAIPLRGNDRIIGVLVCSRQPGSGGFDHFDREMVRAIAAHAGLALELAQIRRENENLRRIEDRARIAESLRQSVIQRLFQLGLKLQGAAARSVKPEVRDTIQEQVGEIDEVIADIRTAVFSLES